MDREEIRKILPHREPMLLVDESYKEGEYAYSKYHVRGDEFFLQGHFPGYPVVPGVILCEMMAQGSVLLLCEKLEGCLPLFAGIDGVRFKRQVMPGDTLDVKSKLASIRGNVCFVEAKATVNGELCCSGKLTVILVKQNNNE